VFAPGETCAPAPPVAFALFTPPRCPPWFSRPSLSAIAFALAIHHLVRLMDLLPPPLVLGRGGLVVPALLVGRLAQQAPVVLEPIRVEFAALDRRRDGAARLAFVRAVGEPATVRESGDVVKRRLDRRFVRPRLKLAHPGRVDEERTARQLDELTRCRRVPAATVCLTDGARAKRVTAEEPVDQRRFADARRADERHRP